jgi:hypothetical protein
MINNADYLYIKDRITLIINQDYFINVILSDMITLLNQMYSVENTNEKSYNFFGLKQELINIQAILNRSNTTNSFSARNLSTFNNALEAYMQINPPW